MRTQFSPRNLTALAAACLSALMLGLEISSIPAILPTLEHVLSADFRQLQWVMNAYTIAMTTSLMAAGALADRFGRKRIFTYGIIVFGVASLVCALTWSAPLLIAARFLQGASGAAMLACQIAVLSHQFHEGSERGAAFGWWGVIFGIGLGFGPLVGGLTVVVLSWEWVFLVHVALALVTLALTRLGVIESSDPHALKLDLAGILTLSLSVFCLVYLITQGQPLTSANPFGLALAGLGLISFLGFIIAETQAARPMFDFNAFRIPTFSGALMGSAGMNFSFWPFVIYLPIYFQAVIGLDSVAAGLALLSYTLPTLIVPPFAERLLTRRGPALVIPLGLFTIGAGFALMRLASTGAHWWMLLPGCVLAGIGLGLTNTPVTNTATRALPPTRVGMASGMDSSARMISLAINIAVMGFLLLQGVRTSLGHSIEASASTSLDLLTERIAGGNFAAAHSAGLTTAAARDALINGFSWVMTYGAGCAWTMALLSLLVFIRKKAVAIE